MLFLIVGSLLPIVATIIYIVSILRGKSRPHRMTRLLILVISGLSLGALAASHDHAGIWLAYVSSGQSIVLWLLSLKRGMGGSERLDMICFGLCFMGIGLWLYSGESLFGLVMSIVADFVACVLSLKKTLRLPHTESWLFYLLDVFAAASIVSASVHTTEALLYPIYILLINAAYVAIILWPRKIDILDV
ncbi:MAG TPA: hypothetical protein VLH38_04460 [Patescibacteria group bacterium]|nr:hypothetical protein [Patescibacteria group bacterium]